MLWAMILCALWLIHDYLYRIFKYEKVLQDGTMLCLVRTYLLTHGWMSKGQWRWETLSKRLQEDIWASAVCLVQTVPGRYTKCGFDPFGLLLVHGQGSGKNHGYKGLQCMWRLTGCNQFKPVFLRSHNILKIERPATRLQKTGPKIDHWSGPNWFGSVRFRSFFVFLYPITIIGWFTTVL